MRIFHSEFAAVYSTYTFAYAVYAEAEDPTDLPEIYRCGFLPYSGDRNVGEIYYLARSLRVRLGDFAPTSENRRIERKMQPLSPHLRIVPKSDFDLSEPHFRQLCLDHARERFRGGELDPDRFDYILNRQTLTHIGVVTVEDNNYPVGYILCAVMGEMLHYWFAFYNTAHMQNGIGKWMMAKTIAWAQENHADFAYLGTCYGSKSLYKANDFRGVEFWDGAQWCGDLAQLTDLCRDDDNQQSADSDRWKHQNRSKSSGDSANRQESDNGKSE